MYEIYKLVKICLQMANIEYYYDSLNIIMN